MNHRNAEARGMKGRGLEAMGYGNLFENPARIKASQPHNMAKVLYLDQGDLHHNCWETRKLELRDPQRH